MQRNKEKSRARTQFSRASGPEKTYQNFLEERCRKKGTGPEDQMTDEEIEYFAERKNEWPG